MNKEIPRKKKISSEMRPAIRSWIVRAALGIVGYGLILFLSAGSIFWIWGWILLILLFTFLAAHLVILLPYNPGLLVERGKGIYAKGVMLWDKWISSIGAGVLPLCSWVIAGLDYRFLWIGSVSLTGRIICLLIIVFGYTLFLWAMSSNTFFSEGVRIQKERGHTVTTGGPYRFIRHPGYSGAILAQIAIPLMLGSLWALIPGIAAGILYMIRTYLEDSYLMKNLEDYDKYSSMVRYRLIPFIW